MSILRAIGRAYAAYQTARATIVIVASGSGGRAGDSAHQNTLLGDLVETR